MAKRTAPRLLSIALVLALAVLSVQVVAHFDGNGHDEDHCTCQVCHIAHAAIPQPTSQAEIQVRLWVARFTPFEQAPGSIELANTVSIPRAPPA